MTTRMKLHALLDLRLWLKVYGLTLVLYFPLAHLTNGWLPPVVVLGQFRFLLCLVAGPLAVLAIAKRERLTSVLLLTGFSFGVLLYRVPLMDVLNPSDGAGTHGLAADLVVETWNLGLERSNPAEVLAHFSGSEAHVLALQEFTPEHEKLLRRGLVDRFPHQLYRGAGSNSLALLSRTALLDEAWFRPASAKPRLEAQVQVRGRRVRVINAHYSAFLAIFSRWWPGQGALDRVARDTPVCPPVILLGDFNTTEASAEYADLIDAGWMNAFEEVGLGFGFTFPVFMRYRGIPSPPLVRIDHIWTLGALHPVSCGLGPESSSDHLPLIASFLLVQE